MKQLSRRDFLKLSALSIGSMAFTPFLPEITEFEATSLVRVAITSVSIYREPSDESAIVGQWYRDDLVTVYDEVEAETPKYNPIWYRVWGGYMHRARLQKVKIHYNPVISSIPEGGQLAEVTVPYSQPFLHDGSTWEPQYRLYYGSVHWVLGLEEGPDGQPWYRILHGAKRFVNLYTPAIHLRLIPPAELSPINPDIPFSQKRIEISKRDQLLTAYENDQVVLQTKVSTGVPSGPNTDNGIPTTTPSGEFNIMSKVPSAHMGEGNLVSDLEAYELPGVPYNSYFTEVGHALHGTYWHDNFGIPMSHGCVNMRTHEARWIYLWSRPVIDPDEREQPGFGTQVIIY